FHVTGVQTCALPISSAGLHLCARLAPGVRVRPGDGLAVERLESYCGEEPAQPGLVLGYGAIPTGAVAAGLRLLRSRMSAGPESGSGRGARRERACGW